MAIIYTFPLKSVANSSDLVIISDSEDGLKTKTTSIASIGTAINVVDSLNALKGDVTLSAGNNITLGTSGNIITINSTAAGVVTSLTTTGASGTAATLTSGVLDIPTPVIPAVPFTSLTTVGTSGVATLTSGVLNIPNYATGGTPGTPLNSIQFNSSSSFSGNAGLTFTLPAGAPKLTIGDFTQDAGGTVEIQSDENGGILRIGGGSQLYYTTIQGSENDTANYKIILPTAGPGGNNKILESNSTGALSWINTPSGTSEALDGFETLPFTTANGYLTGETSAGTYVFQRIAPSNCTPTAFKFYNNLAQSTGRTTTVAIYKGVIGAEGAAGSLQSTGQIAGALGAAQISGSTLTKVDGAAAISAGDNIVICFSIDEEIQPLSVIPITASGGITLTNASPLSNGKLAIHDPNVSLTAAQITANATTVSALEALLTTSAATTFRPFLLIY